MAHTIVHWLSIYIIRPSYLPRWESGYWCTMDIAHDRAGYYLCWGCLVWVPSIYTSPALYLVKQPINLHPLLATAFFVAGTLSDMYTFGVQRRTGDKDVTPHLREKTSIIK